MGDENIPKAYEVVDLLKGHDGNNANIVRVHRDLHMQLLQRTGTWGGVPMCLDDFGASEEVQETLRWLWKLCAKRKLCAKIETIPNRDLEEIRMASRRSLYQRLHDEGVIAFCRVDRWPSGSATARDTICLIWHPKGFAIGVTCQSEDDQYNRAIGNDWAFKRAMRNLRKGRLLKLRLVGDGVCMMLEEVVRRMPDGRRDFLGPYPTMYESAQIQHCANAMDQHCATRYLGQAIADDDMEAVAEIADEANGEVAATHSA